MESELQQYSRVRGLTEVLKQLDAACMARLGATLSHLLRSVRCWLLERRREWTLLGKNFEVSSLPAEKKHNVRQQTRQIAANMR